MKDKLNRMIQSRRFWVAVAAVVSVVFQDALGLDEQQATKLAGIAIAWIAGDTWRET